MVEVEVSLCCLSPCTVDWLRGLRMLLMADFLFEDAALIATTLLSTSAASTASSLISSRAVLLPPGMSLFFFSSSSSSSSSSSLLSLTTRLRSRSSVDTALSATWQLGFICASGTGSTNHRYGTIPAPSLLTHTNQLNSYFERILPFLVVGQY